MSAALGSYQGGYVPVLEQAQRRDANPNPPKQEGQYFARTAKYVGEMIGAVDRHNPLSNIFTGAALVAPALTSIVAGFENNKGTEKLDAIQLTPGTTITTQQVDDFTNGRHSTQVAGKFLTGGLLTSSASAACDAGNRLVQLYYTGYPSQQKVSEILAKLGAQPLKDSSWKSFTRKVSYIVSTAAFAAVAYVNVVKEGPAEATALYTTGGTVMANLFTRELALNPFTAVKNSMPIIIGALQESLNAVEQGNIQGPGNRKSFAELVEDFRLTQRHNYLAREIVQNLFCVQNFSPEQAHEVSMKYDQNDRQSILSLFEIANSTVFSRNRSVSRSSMAQVV